MKKYIWTYWTDGIRDRDFLWDLLCFSVSVELVKKFSDKICIYTDERGLKAFEEKQLNYPIEVIDFQIKESYYPKFSEAKLKVMSRQEEPFCHIDHDVFLFEEQPRFPEFDIVVQTVECSETYYKPTYFLAYYNDGMLNVQVPEEMKKCVKERDFCGYNCGYIDVNNLSVCHEWCKEGIKISEQYDPRFKFSNIVPEQFCLYSLAKHRGYKIKALFEIASLGFLNGSPKQNIDGTLGMAKQIDAVKQSLSEDIPGCLDETYSYLHLMGSKNTAYDEVINRLLCTAQRVAPDFYKRLTQSEIDLLMNPFDEIDSEATQAENAKLNHLRNILLKRKPELIQKTNGA